jgi:hypothetical protein
MEERGVMSADRAGGAVAPRVLRWIAAALLWIVAAAVVVTCGGTGSTRSDPRPSGSPGATSSPTAGVAGPSPGQRTPAPGQRAQPGPAGAACSVPAPPSLIGLGVPAPVRIRIPAIGVDSTLSKLERNPDGTIQVPPDQDQAGWYRRGVAPGDLGAAVIMGDVGAPSGPGVFRSLPSTHAGDAIRIQREDGSELLFTVRRTLAFSPAAFPAGEVYGVGAQPELRLITCGGTAASGGPPAAGDVVVLAVLAG